MNKTVSIYVKCPKCRMSLMDHDNKINDKPSIKLNILSGKERGVIRLCSIYGNYDHEANIDLSKADITEFSCPNCNQILNSNELCTKCNAPMVPFIMDIGGKVSICSRKGCVNHYVAIEDLYNTLNKFYDEYGF